MIVEQFAVGPLQCNCVVLADDLTKRAIVIDPGDECDRIYAVLHARGLQLVGIVATHAHIDHVGALAQLKQRTGAPAMLHEADVPLYEQLALQASWLGIPVPPVTMIDRLVLDGDELAFGKHALRVVHTPGHSPGSISLVLDQQQPTVFSGDTLFAGSIGRTDLWGGSFESLLRSITRRLLTLPDDAVVIPGHGPPTTVGAERESNPFLQRRA
ncbi:MAG: MBL fold metallo-hydrolase [Candidatus Eremiobacteraeota bacterium]|nr:MBL fold metallo-hydrolase [Candidatus Eremiobacteraeota bacterium]